MKKTEIAQLYDEISKNYDLADTYGSLTLSRQEARKQFQSYLKTYPKTSALYKILDAGIGDGTYVTNLIPIVTDHQLSPNITGLDISPKMLSLASKKLELHTLLGTIHEIDQLATPGEFSLIICHFILAYVEIAIVLKKAHLMAKPGGIISLITTTSEGMAKCRKSIENYIAKGGVGGFVVKTIFERTLKSLRIPDSFTTIEKAIHRSHLQILERKRIHIPVTFKNLDEFLDVGFKGGWIANLMDHKYIPASLAFSLAKRFFGTTLQFPIEDTHIIEVLLLKKPV